MATDVAAVATSYFVKNSKISCLLMLSKKN